MLAAWTCSGCNGCDCTWPTVRVWLVDPAGGPLPTTKLDLLPSRPDLVLDAPVCGQTEPVSNACLEWTCTIRAGSESNDGAFVLVGTATTVAGKQLPLTIPLQVSTTGDVCCGAVFAPADVTIAVPN